MDQLTASAAGYAGDLTPDDVGQRITFTLTTQGIVVSGELEQVQRLGALPWTSIRVDGATFSLPDGKPVELGSAAVLIP